MIEATTGSGGAISEAAASLTTEAGFRMFYEQTQPAVYRLCRFETADPETALDLCQEAFASAYRARLSLREGASARAWVLRIALNACRSHVRRRGLAAFLRSLMPWTSGAGPGLSRVRFARSLSKSAGQGGMAGLADSAPGPEAAAEGREREVQVRSAIAALPARERAAMALVALQGLSYREAAEVLECSEAVVRQAVSRARRHLRDALEDSAAAGAVTQPQGGAL